MPKQTFHFLNVKDGDCSVIEHRSGHVSVIDVCNARKPEAVTMMSLAEAIYLENSAALSAKMSGVKNYNQKKYPVNPIEYLHSFDIYSVFRFVTTHPDMDHIDGIKDFFDEFCPTNYYDTNNTAEKDFSSNNGKYREEDWKFYKKLREENPQTNPKRLTVFSGDRGIHRTKDWNGNPPGDAFYVLAPTPELVELGNETEDYNDASYVILYSGAGGRILLSGDSHDDTWEHLLENHKDSIKDVDLLIAPHHGRASGRSYKFLDTVNPKMTFFGNAACEHLAYGAWRNRKLEFITNNQANCMVVDTSSNLTLYVTNENFARDRNPFTWYSQTYKGWFLKEITGWDLQ